jgi:hypothetical protein
MKTAIPSSNSLKKVPPLSALLLVLAALLALAAWRVLEINQHRVPLEPPAAAKQDRRLSASSGLRATYQAHRHQAVPLSSSSASMSATGSDAAGPDPLKAVL